MSVEGIVVVLVAAAALGIVAVQMWAGGWEDPSSRAPSNVIGLRHDAISEAPTSDNSQGVAAAAADDQDKSSQRSANSNETVVRNGVTILSPPLLVPVINDDAIQRANGSEVLTSPRKAPSARKRSHYANRDHRRSQRRVVRSAPFWRVVDR